MRLEHLHLAPRDHLALQAADQLLGLAREHRAADDLDLTHHFPLGRKRTQRSASTPSLPGRASNSASRSSEARSANSRAPAEAMPPCSIPARSIDFTTPAMLTQKFCCPGTSKPCTPMRLNSWPSEVLSGGCSTRARMPRSSRVSSFLGGAAFFLPFFAGTGASSGGGGGGPPPSARKKMSPLIAACAASPRRNT